MDRAILQRQLAAAEHQAVMGEHRLERQRAILERRRSLGQDSDEAAELLVEFEREQALLRAEVERLREQLASAT
jgi:hypothetical protein